MIKAIETRYKGYRFRSRLEARWAVFFDACGIAWEYEPEGFVVPGHGKYLPDFFLVKECLYVEVKPDAKPLGDQFDKYAAFAASVRRGFLFVDGVPDSRFYTGIAPNGTVYRICFGLSDLRRATFFRADPKDYEHGEPASNGCLEQIYVARAARFEYGERPA